MANVQLDKKGVPVHSQSANQNNLNFSQQIANTDSSIVVNSKLRKTDMTASNPIQIEDGSVIKDCNSSVDVPLFNRDFLPKMVQNGQLVNPKAAASAS